MLVLCLILLTASTLPLVLFAYWHYLGAKRDILQALCSVAVHHRYFRIGDACYKWAMCADDRKQLLSRWAARFADTVREWQHERE